jgi:hypothetical protein
LVQEVRSAGHSDPVDPAERERRDFKALAAAKDPSRVVPDLAADLVVADPAEDSAAGAEVAVAVAPASVAEDVVDSAATVAAVGAKEEGGADPVPG